MFQIIYFFLSEFDIRVLSRDFYIHPNCQIYWHRATLILIFWYPFNIFRICSDVISFITDISHLYFFFLFFFFFLISLARFIILPVFSENWLLVSLIFSINFLFHWFLIDFYYFLSFTYLGPNLHSSPNLVEWKLVSLTWEYFLFY